MKTYIHFWSYLAQFFLEWEMFHAWGVEKIKKKKKHFMFNKLSPRPFRKPYLVWDDVEKYWRAGQATDGNMAHACFILNT